MKELKTGKCTQEGRDAFQTNPGPYCDCPYNEVGEDRSSFFDGWRAASNEHTEKLTADFRIELDKLCKKYKVDLSTGCGCCGGASIKDESGNNWEFSV
jgi:hypothetical protein